MVFIIDYITVLCIKYRSADDVFYHIAFHIRLHAYFCNSLNFEIIKKVPSTRVDCTRLRMCTYVCMRMYVYVCMTVQCTLYAIAYMVTIF